MKHDLHEKSHMGTVIVLCGAEYGRSDRGTQQLPPLAATGRKEGQGQGGLEVDLLIYGNYIKSLLAVK